MPKIVYTETDYGTKVVVLATHIPKTCVVVYETWELSSTPGDHTAMITFDGKLYGKVGTKRFGAPAAITAAKIFYKSQKHIAHSCILKAFPHLTHPRRCTDIRRNDCEMVEAFQSVFEAKTSCEEEVICVQS